MPPRPKIVFVFKSDAEVGKSSSEEDEMRKTFECIEHLNTTKIIESDPRLDMAYIVIKPYQNGAPQIDQFGKLYTDDSVLIVLLTQDKYACQLAIEIVAARAQRVEVLQLYDYEGRSDKASSHAMAQVHNRQISHDDQNHIHREEHSTAAIGYKLLSQSVRYLWVLEAHSDVASTAKSQPYPAMIIFAEAMMNRLVDSIEHLCDPQKTAIVFCLADASSEKKYKPVLECLCKKMELAPYFIKVDKVRTGKGAQSTTKSTLLIDPELLEEIRQHYQVALIGFDDMGSSYATMLDSLQLGCDAFAGCRVLSVAATFHIDSIPRNKVTGRFDALDRINGLIESGKLHAAFVSDSNFETTRYIDETYKMQVIPTSSAVIYGVLGRAGFW